MQTPANEKNWVPSLIPPSSGTMHAYFSDESLATHSYLWGNVAAYDILNIGRNADGLARDRNIKICFAGTLALATLNSILGSLANHVV